MRLVNLQYGALHRGELEVIRLAHELKEIHGCLNRKLIKNQ